MINPPFNHQVLVYHQRNHKPTASNTVRIPTSSKDFLPSWRSGCCCFESSRQPGQGPRCSRSPARCARGASAAAWAFSWAAEELEARIGLGQVFVEILEEKANSKRIAVWKQPKSNLTALEDKTGGVTHQIGVGSVFGENLQASADTSCHPCISINPILLWVPSVYWNHTGAIHSDCIVGNLVIHGKPHYLWCFL